MSKPAVTCALLGLALLAGCKHVPTEEEERHATYQRDLGATALAQKNYRNALEELNKGEKLNPNDAEIQYALGMTYFTGFSRYKEAQEHLENATRLKENFSDAENSLGVVLMAQGKFAAAIPLFERAKSNLIWGSPHLAEQNLGWALYKTGKTDEAIAHLRSAIGMQPQLCGAYDYLGVIYSESGKDKETVLWGDKYLAVCDTEKLRGYLPPQQLSSNLYRMGMANVRLGNRDAAKNQFQACVERFSEDQVGPLCRQNLLLLN